MLRSARRRVLVDAVTVVVALAESFAELGSPYLPLTVAVFVTEPGVGALATIVKLVLAPGARSDRWHTSGVPEQAPPRLVETSVRLCASGSVTVTPAAGWGPLFVT